MAGAASKSNSGPAGRVFGLGVKLRSGLEGFTQRAKTAKENEFGADSFPRISEAEFAPSDWVWLSRFSVAIATLYVGFYLVP